MWILGNIFYLVWLYWSLENEIYLPWTTRTTSPTDQSVTQTGTGVRPGLWHVSNWAGDSWTEDLGRAEMWRWWWLSSNDQNTWNSTIFTLDDGRVRKFSNNSVNFILQPNITLPVENETSVHQSVGYSVPAVAGDVVVVVEVGVEVDPIWWVQGTGAVWHEEQEESLFSQLERSTQTLPMISTVLSYLTQSLL